MKNVLTFVLSVFALFVSCKKDKAEESHSQIFTAKERRIKSFVKVYTKDGEVTDQKLLSSFLAKDYEDFFRESPGIMKAESDTIIYLSADSVKIVLDGHSSLSNTPASNNIKSSQIYKIKKEGSYSFYSDSKYLRLLTSVPDSVFNKGAERFFKHKPFKLEQPPIFGMPDLIYYYPFVVFESAHELKFPFVNLKLTQARTVNNFTYSNEVALSVNNEFNAAILGTLHVGDTLAVQTSELIFERK